MATSETLATGPELKTRDLVRKEGFEPPRPFGHKILSLARLPVPPLPHGCVSILSIAVPAFHQDFATSMAVYKGPKLDLFVVGKPGNSSGFGRGLGA